MITPSVAFERLIDIVVPLAVLAIVMQLGDKGFPTLWPVAAGSLYVIIQPALRIFFDHVREPLIAFRHYNMYLGAMALVHALLVAVVLHIIL